MKRNHDLLAPIFAADVSKEGKKTRIYYLSIFLTKFAAGVVSATILFHLHQCFTWSSLMAMAGTTGGAGTNTSANTVNERPDTLLWWYGKGVR